jgi:hypothetical protein
MNVNSTARPITMIKPENPGKPESPGGNAPGQNKPPQPTPVVPQGLPRFAHEMMAKVRAGEPLNADAKAYAVAAAKADTLRDVIAINSREQNAAVAVALLEANRAYAAANRLAA